MPVTSTPLSSTAPAHAKSESGCALLVGRIGVWLAVASFGGIFWAVNGGFSVIGLGALASSFNDSGRLFWAVISQWHFTIPIDAPGLPTTQPLIPWIGVVAASLLQISVAWLKLSKQRIPYTLFVTAILLSLYDYVTTFFGLKSMPWLALGGPVPAALLAIPLTFALEITIGYALKRK